MEDDSRRSFAMTEETRTMRAQHSISWESSDWCADVPSDEEAQDLVRWRSEGTVQPPPSRHRHLLVLGTPTRRGRRLVRSRSLQSIPHLKSAGSLHSNASRESWINSGRIRPTAFTWSAPYGGAMTDTTTFSDEEDDDHDEDVEYATSPFRHRVSVPSPRSPSETAVELSGPRSTTRWPLRIALLLLCAYVALLSDPSRESNRVLAESKKTAAFSSQHGREVAFPIQRMGDATPVVVQLEDPTAVFTPPQTQQRRSKRRPIFAHARQATNKSPVFGEAHATYERFVLPEEDSWTPPTSHPDESGSIVQRLGWLALILLVFEMAIREGHRRWHPSSSRRIRNE